MKQLVALLLFASTATALVAEPPEIIKVIAEESGAGWRFEVTLKHPDTGWDHYADGWEILDADGNRLGYRELYHPHVDEQPFTRSLTSVKLPEGSEQVFVRAKCSVDGWSSETIPVAIAR